MRTEQQTFRIECDRCGAKIEFDNQVEFANQMDANKGWSAIVHGPVGANLTWTTDTTQSDLCKDCTTAYLSWFATAP